MSIKYSSGALLILVRSNHGNLALGGQLWRESTTVNGAVMPGLKGVRRNFRKWLSVAWRAQAPTPNAICTEMLNAEPAPVERHIRPVGQENV